jgi:hypothetical protein
MKMTTRCSVDVCDDLQLSHAAEGGAHPACLDLLVQQRAAVCSWRSSSTPEIARDLNLWCLGGLFDHSLKLIAGRA